MGERIKMFVFVAILGFFAGMIADLTATYAIPALTNILPAFISSTYLLSGFAGACLTVALVSVWAYITGPPDR